MVVNCKERPGSIETKTQKKKKMTTIDISQELDFYAEVKYRSCIKFSNPLKVTGQRKFTLFLKKGRNNPPPQKKVLES